MSGLLSADKLHTLRVVTGASLPDSKLRAALARAAGDLNLAASRLLADAAVAAAPLRVPAPSPSAPPQPARAQPHKQPLQRAASSDVAHARRLAWRQFYCEHHADALRHTGGEKKLVDEYVVNLWKQLGSKGRQRFTNDVLRRVEQEARADHQPQQAHAAKHAHEAALHAADEKQPKPHPQPLPTNVAAQSAPDAERTNVKPVPPQPAPDTQRHSPPPAEPPVAQSSIAQPPTAPSPSAKRPRAVEWPRELTTRSGRGIMLTRGRNLLNAGDRLQLSIPAARPKKAREKKLPTRLVRFCKNGRELGRLAPDLAHALAPGLQSGFVEGQAKVLWAPRHIGMFAEILVEVALFINKDAFAGNSAGVEAGLGDDGEGIDAKRVNVVSMILDLKLCEQPREKTPPDGEHALNADDPGAVDESAAETYYKTVDKINEQEASKYQPPKSLACTLREYQRVGVLWMTGQEKYGRRGRGLAPTLINPLWKKCSFADGGVFYMNTTTGCLSLDSPVESTGGPYGGILADEMGLGKTVQCIACILHDIGEERGSSGTTKQKESETEGMELTDDCVNNKENGSPPPQQDTAKNQKYDTNADMDVDGTQDDHRAQISEPEPEPVEQDKKTLSCDEGGMHQSSNSNMDGGALGRRPHCARLGSLRSRVRKPKRAFQEYAEDEITCAKNESDKEDEEFSVDKGESSDDDWVEVKRRRPESKRKRPKTGEGLQSAASVLMASASKKKASFGGTLIVCPTSLVTQWINQLNQHVTPNFLRVTTHYGQGRGDARSISLLGADVVVTSYGTLAAECSEDTANGEEIGPRDGPLFQLQWRRIILDEAHTIKSRVTKWAKASYKINAERRWCVTGTVIHNHVNDVYSLLHFLDVKPWSSWAFWNRVIVSNLESNNIALQKTAMTLIRDIISSVTLRRKKTTKDSQGNCIVQLTKKTVSLVELTPSSQERDFYTAIHQRSKLQFDTYLAQDKVMHNYASVLELLLRLRQACDHPYLVFAAAPSKDSIVMKDRDKLFKQFLEAGSSAEYVEKVFKEVESGAMGKTSQCPFCLDIIDDPVAPKECGHPACRVCMMESLKRATKCPVCRIPITRESVATLPRKSRFSVDLSKKWRSSAKIDELLKDVRTRQELREESKGKGIGKTVIFSQFTSMLDLVGTALDGENFRWLRIDGSVPQAQRAIILDKFEKESELSRDSSNILLVSLRAGGVGLNLVAASFAILLDIHWNPQVDAQAQDRIHRHGQTRDVLIKRYIVKDTVEEKLLQVQARKQSIADGALEVATDEDRKQAKLSELKLLFSTS